MHANYFPLLMFILVGWAPALASDSQYLLESHRLIFHELIKKQYQASVQAWVAESRPDRPEYQTWLDEEAARERGETQPGSDLFWALLNTSVPFDGMTLLLLDYHINKKASEGWEVAAMTDHSILFRRTTAPSKGGQDEADQPATDAGSEPD